MAPYDTTLGGLASLAAVLLFLTTTTLTFRLVARYKQRLSIGLDDYAATAAWLLFIGTSAVALYCMNSIHFLGYQVPGDKTMAGQIAAAAPKALLPGLLLSTLSLGFIRLSALLFYRRIFIVGREGAFGIVTIIGIVVVSLWTIGFFFDTLFACGTNIAGYWSPNARTECIVYANQKGIAGSSFALDCLILLLPLPKIVALHTTISRKLAIAGVFLFALIGLGASCARLVILVEIEDKGSTANAADPFANSQMWFYQLLEGGMCLTAVNLPSIWYFVHQISPESVLRSVRSLVSLRSTKSSEVVGKAMSNERSSEETAEPTSNSAVPTRREGLEKEQHGENKL